jgi:hypothetical protein
MTVVERRDVLCRTKCDPFTPARFFARSTWFRSNECQRTGAGDRRASQPHQRDCGRARCHGRHGAAPRTCVQTSPEFWLNLQPAFDLRTVASHSKRPITRGSRENVVFSDSRT